MSSDVNPAPELRTARVARTETLLVAAARELFLEQGYVATTLAQVAQRAGIAARTVYVRFGTKAALFRRAVDEALVDVTMGIVERAAALFDVAAQAEGLEPEVAQTGAAGRAATADICRRFWANAQQDGLLSPTADVQALAITTDVLICADTILHLHRTQRWSLKDHREWLRAALVALPHSLPPPSRG